MKQKHVIKVSLNDHASRFCCFGPQIRQPKAFRLASRFPGVQSVALKRDQDRIEVTGEVDVVNLITLLRKKVGFAEILSVSGADTQGRPGGSVNPPNYTNEQPVVGPYPYYELVYVEDPPPVPWCWPL